MAQTKQQKNGITPRNREAEAGEFIPANDARKRTRTTTDEEAKTVTPDENAGERQMLGKRHS